MFQVWTRLTHRPTRDLDLLGFGLPDIDHLARVFRDLCDQPVEDDGLVFMADTVSASKLKEDEEYEGIRIKFDAKLVQSEAYRHLSVGSIARLVGRAIAHLAVRGRSGRLPSRIHRSF